jgi:hypothetical protein
LVNARECAQSGAVCGSSWRTISRIAGTNAVGEPSVRTAKHAAGERVRTAGCLNTPRRNSTPGTTANDPDKNTLTIKWWQYADADTYPGTIAFPAPDSLKTTFQVPQDAASGQTIHALIQVTDNGIPALTSFQRVIVTVKAP